MINFCYDCGYAHEMSTLDEHINIRCFNNVKADLVASRSYADKLAAGLPEGMLPKDVENMRNANAKMAGELDAAEARAVAAELKYKNLCVEIAIEGQDPNGSIWDYAKKLRDELDSEKAEHFKLRCKYGNETAILGEELRIAKAYLAGANRQVDNYNGQLNQQSDRAKKAEKALTAANEKLTAASRNGDANLEALTQCQAELSVERDAHSKLKKEFNDFVYEHTPLCATEKKDLMSMNSRLTERILRCSEIAFERDEEKKKRVKAEEQLANVQKANMRQMETVRQAREAQYWAQGEAYKSKADATATRDDMRRKQERLDKLVELLTETNAKVSEYDHLFDLQVKRMHEASELWRAAQPEGEEFCMPDLGELLTWLMKQAEGKKVVGE